MEVGSNESTALRVQGRFRVLIMLRFPKEKASGFSSKAFCFLRVPPYSHVPGTHCTGKKDSKLSSSSTDSGP